MTPQEVKEACEKFHAYLTANGVTVKGHVIHFDDRIVITMEPDTAIGALLCMVADSRGYKMVPK
jgi:hypothetical protein